MTIRGSQRRLKKLEELRKPAESIAKRQARIDDTLRLLDHWPEELMGDGCVYRKPSEAGDLTPEPPILRGQFDFHSVPGDHEKPYVLPVSEQRVGELREECRGIAKKYRSGIVTEYRELWGLLPVECLLGYCAQAWVHMRASGIEMTVEELWGPEGAV